MVDELIEELIRKQLRQYDQMKATLAAQPAPQPMATQAMDQRITRHELCRPSVGRRSNGNQIPVGSNEKLPVRNRGRRNALLAQAVSGENFRFPSRSQD